MSELKSKLSQFEGKLKQTEEKLTNNEVGAEVKSEKKQKVVVCENVPEVKTESKRNFFSKLITPELISTVAPILVAGFGMYWKNTTKQVPEKQVAPQVLPQVVPHQEKVFTGQRRPLSTIFPRSN
jgi:hypothetical protein